MHTIVEPTRAGIFVPLENRERIALYRARIDETSEFHRDRALAGLAWRASLGMTPVPAMSSTDATRPAFTPQGSRSPVATASLLPAVASSPVPRPEALRQPGTDSYADARSYAHAAACAELDPTT